MKLIINPPTIKPITYNGFETTNKRLYNCIAISCWPVIINVCTIALKVNCPKKSITIYSINAITVVIIAIIRAVDTVLMFVTVPSSSILNTIEVFFEIRLYNQLSIKFLYTLTINVPNINVGIINAIIAILFKDIAPNTTNIIIDIIIENIKDIVVAIIVTELISNDFNLFTVVIIYLLKPFF